ncbi:MAG: hypothetical protein AAFO82_12570 [Bacteroidota bacterium]
MTGFSLELGDKRVNKIILNKGFKESEIFYSPISVWFTFWILLSVITIPMALEFLFHYFSEFSFPRGMLFIGIYILLCYVIIVILNRSFAITEKEFLIINSHFPLQTLQSFEFEEIEEIKISSDWKLKFMIIFGLFYTNYVQVKTKDGRKRFYCLFLDFDCYDENWTEKTLDDLYKDLCLKGLNVNMPL